MNLGNFNYYCPSSIRESEKLISTLDNAKILAGGTWLLNLLKQSHSLAENIISLKDIAELRKIEKKNSSIRIGAMANLDDLARNNLIKSHFPILPECINKIATPQIRNMATLGGNICSRLPWADLGYILLALDAELHFVGNAISIADYFSRKFDSALLLNKIYLPLEKIEKYAFYRLPQTNQSDIPLCAVCILKRGKEIVVSANLGNNFPCKFKSALDFDTFSKELKMVQKDEYRYAMLQVCFKRAKALYEA